MATKYNVSEVQVGQAIRLPAGGRRFACPTKAKLALLVAMAPAAAMAHDVITTNLTWSQEISRIVYKHCASCHRGGGTAMSLTTYEEARPWAKAIRDEILERRMPPWDAVKGVGDFRGDESLSQPEIDMLVAWAEGGAPEGNPIYLPHPPHFDPPEPQPRGKEIQLRGTLSLAKRMKLAGIRPQGPLEVTALLPDGTVERLLWIRTFHEKWKRTYYFREPVELPKGTKLMLYAPAGSAATLIEAARVTRSAAARTAKSADRMRP